MSQKRHPDELKERSDRILPEEKRPKVPALQRVINEVIRTENVNKFLHALEPLLRRVVKEEIELALANHFTTGEKQNEKEISPLPSPCPSPSQSLQLEFTTKLSLPIFTGAKIEAEKCCPLSIRLVERVTGAIITCGPVSPLKVEIVVLEGDFDLSEKGLSWNPEEFRSYVVKEREGRRPLLNGDAIVELKYGLGSVGELSFTDNSSWTRSRRFRLGALAEDGCLNGIHIKEAVTESFMVKDHRGELYKKHHPPVIDDEVWRLEKIGKDGAFHKRLNNQNIKTVKDFLTSLNHDPARLRNILGNGMSTKMWETVVEHARTCVLTNEMHVYHHHGSQKQGALVFNVVGELKGVISDQGQFISIDDLSEKEIADANTTAEEAYKSWENLPILDMSTLLGSKSLVSNGSNPMSPPYNNSTNLLNSDQFGPIHSNIPSPDIFSLGVTREPRDHLPLYDDCSSSAFYDASPLPCMDSLVDTSDLGVALRGFLGSPYELSHSKAYKGWRTLSYVLGWIFYIKKVVARRKRGKERLC